MAVGIEWICPGSNYILIAARRIWYIVEHFSNSLSADGQGIAVQTIVDQQHFHHLWNAAGSMQVSSNVTARWFQITKHRNAFANHLEVVKKQRDLRSVGDREQMQHGVSGTTYCHHDGNRVFKRFSCQDLAR